MQVDNAYNEFQGKVVADLGCGTVSVQLSSVTAVLLSMLHGLDDSDIRTVPMSVCQEFI